MMMCWLKPATRKVLTVVETKSQVRRKKAIVRSRLVPLSHDGHHQDLPCFSAGGSLASLEQASDEGKALADS